MSELDLSLGFRDVDGAGDVATFAGYLDALAALEPVREAKRRRDRVLAARGARVLELGCGTGEDARAMGRLVGPGGRVVGLDASEGLLALARERTGPEDGPVEWVRADAAALPFAEDSFDAVRIERVLQHVEDPQAVIAEAARVLCPGGRLAAVETDWGTLAMDLGPLDQAESVTAMLARGVRWPWAGRALWRWLSEAGLADVQVEAEPVVMVVDPWSMPDGERLLRVVARRAREAGVAWGALLDAARARAPAGGWFVSLVMFAAHGRRPLGHAGPL
jgi:ubiquinone/menaquinone biosynthesis C-methylase UbiE